MIALGSDDQQPSDSGASRLKQIYKIRDSPTLNSTATSRRSSVDLTPHFNNLSAGKNPHINDNLYCKYTILFIFKSFYVFSIN